METNDFVPNRGDGVESRVPSATHERFFMPSIYKPDQSWARAMQGAVVSGVDLLQHNPQASFDDFIGTMIGTARAGLAERVAAFHGSEDETVKVRSHAENFGVKRKGSQRVTSISDHGAMAVFKDEAVETLKRLGTHTEEDGVWGQFSARRGQSFKKEVYSLQHSFDTPDGTVSLCSVKSDWIPTHEEEYVRTPFREVTIISPTVDVIDPMFKAGNTVLDEVKGLKEQIDKGSIPKDEATLNRLTNYAAEVYWMISQTWPYERGSAGVADLASKAIFDWLNVHTPSWKDTVNPNTIALLKPLKEFQQDYPTLYKEPLNWES
jgi:hypothetical protein